MKKMSRVVLGGTWLVVGAGLAFVGLMQAEMPAVVVGLGMGFTGLIFLLDGLL